MQIVITEAYSYIEDVRTLFTEYAASLGIDLGYQNFAEELSHLPGKYAKPDGSLYIAIADGAIAGCAAMRRFDQRRAEMKRLYVRTAYRGLRLGRLLAERIIKDAQSIGYESILLDTLSSMERAQNLYRSLGFVEIMPYYDSPVEGTTFLRLSL